MTERPFSNDKLDELIRASLLEEETPPLALQSALIRKVRNHKSSWSIPWWSPVIIGGMQTATFVTGIHLLLPGSALSDWAMFGGVCLILCAGVLSGLLRKTQARKEVRHLWG